MKAILGLILASRDTTSYPTLRLTNNARIDILLKNHQMAVLIGSLLQI